LVGQRREIDVDRYVGFVLTSGVIVSLTILILGAALYLAHPSAAAAPRTLSGILKGTLALNPSATINLGLLVLLMTPIVRIIAAGIAFAIEGAYRFALISLGVLIILTISTLTGYVSGGH
jgi:uncharacterized membrane protein